MGENKITETAEFIQHHLPGLDDGEYGITVSHEFKGPKIPDGSDTTDALSYKFAVKGPRFLFQDPNVVQNVFPPKNAKGEFSNVIPHVVLKNETLPWSRVPTTTANNTGVNKEFFQDKKGTKHDLDVPVWMAVLLLTEDDFNDDSKYPGTEDRIEMEVKSKTIADLFPGSGDAFISSVSSTGETADNLPPWEAPTTNCQVLDIPIKAFKGIAPSLADLFMMGNVRKVDMTQKPIAPGIEIEPKGTFSIVMGNRIPATGKRHLAVLVSLENMQDYLPDWEGNAPTGIPAAATFARLPVFYQWNFLSTGDPFSFEHLLESLNDRKPDGKSQIHGPLPHPELRLYPLPGKTADENSPGEKAISMGYVPLKHITRNAQTTASWYRGPFIPFALTSDNNTVHPFNSDGSNAIQDADALVRINPETGLFDTSYGAAWQIGRLLSLQDKDFSTVLYQWKRGMTDSLIRLLEDNVIDDSFEEILALLKLLDVDISKEDTSRDNLYTSALGLLANNVKLNK